MDEINVINVEFSRDEALILFEWLVRMDETRSIQDKDEAEQKALWLLEGKLEMSLTEIFKPNYRNLLAEAKKRLLDKAIG